ncbi:MAG TPA: cation-transporting P-type ATPase [Candidatus Saccharibacteria bacterium]|nr:cation-transporting P-type ATPase [Candidatus Saccharibacteria bacterium]
MLYYNESVEHTLRDLESSERGLSSSEADERTKMYGLNEVVVKGEPLWRKLIEPFANIFMLVLFVAVAISVWHHEYLDAIIIGAIIAVSAIIYYVQRFSTERILRALSTHTKQRVDTWRNGKIIQLDALQLVPGDVIVLTEGEKVPADARIIAEGDLRVDESLLTGESQPISKQVDTLQGEKEVYDQSNMLFQGSFVVAGEATAVVVRTGNDTEFGELATLSANTQTPSPVQQKIDALINRIIIVVAGMAVVAFGLATLRSMELVEAVRFVVALSVSAVPESLPVAISVVLVLGMRRIAAKKALVRSMRAIETVGALTTIATDKTGTLTKNQLTVHEVWQSHIRKHQMSRSLTHIINQAHHKSHDPLDIAIANYASEQKFAHPKASVAHSLPFNQEWAMSGNMWHHGEQYVLDVKGAPEILMQQSLLTATQRSKATEALRELTAKGYRVIGVATVLLHKPIKSFDELPAKTKFDLVGFIGVADILRPEAKQAIALATGAGVTVRMITGDHKETAYHIAKELGMVATKDQVFDSRTMHTMTDAELEKAISDVRVFSRVIPEHKYRILTILKRNNVTAMTGDGVNDVPALANAHVGVAMGSGSHIARDAGDIVLLNDNFKSIIDAIQEGRTIISNIRRMLYYLLATNTGEVLTTLGALLVGMPAPIAPVQILWINLVTDSALVIPLGLEPGSRNAMRRKPTSPSAPILDRIIIVRMLLVALTMAAVTLTMYAYFLSTHGHDYARTIAFSALVVMQWANALNARGTFDSLLRRIWVYNPAFLIGLTIAVSLQALAIFGPLGSFLHVSPVALSDLVVTGLIAFIVPVVVVEVHKYIGRRQGHHVS